jgi:cysteine synthase A
MSLYDSMKELIGNTPLVRLNHLGFPGEVQIYAKLELYNPSGSVKDRIGTYMIQDAAKRGVLKPGDTIIEATAGNTGLGIAFAALNQGYRLIFVVPEKFSQEKQILLKALGADIVSTPLEEGMLGAARKAEELRAGIPHSVTLEQFKNMVNPLAHYETTGPELYRDLNGELDYVVAGAGSGGTYTGILKYLKEQDPKIKGVLADPIGSTLGGGEHANYEIEGIGNDFVADTMDMSLVDRVIKISDAEALKEVKNIARYEGIFAGSSSGAALAAARKLAETIPSGRIAVIFPDRGDRYFSKHIFD